MHIATKISRSDCLINRPGIGTNVSMWALSIWNLINLDVSQTEMNEPRRKMLVIRYFFSAPLVSYKRTYHYLISIMQLLQRAKISSIFMRKEDSIKETYIISVVADLIYEIVI